LKSRAHVIVIRTNKRERLTREESDGARKKGKLALIEAFLVSMKAKTANESRLSRGGAR
jgi:hypothetical protein